MHSGRNVLDGRNLQSAIPVVTGPILDNVRIGSFVACVARVFASANVDTAFIHQLGRVPNGVAIVYRNSTGGVIYDASTGIAAWTASSITLRATVAGTYSFLLF